LEIVTGVRFVAGVGEEGPKASTVQITDKPSEKNQRYVNIELNMRCFSTENTFNTVFIKTERISVVYLQNTSIRFSLNKGPSRIAG
jgi:hypothetical protein